MSDLDLIRSQIEQITEEINRLNVTYPPREEGDIDIFQLMAAWNCSEGTARRKMNLVAKNSTTTGWKRVMVYDAEKHHRVNVLRKIP